MSETTPEPTPTSEPSDPKPTETVEFWKQKAREQEKRAKDNADAAKRLAEIEDAKKSEAEKAADRARELEDKANGAEARALRAEVALEKGLTLSQAKRLVGATREELEADADELLKDIGAQKKQGNRVPREGQTPAPSDNPMSAFTRNLFARADG